MNADFKKILTENAISRINELFPDADNLPKEFSNRIAKISVVSAITVLEEYEKLKDSQ